MPVEAFLDSNVLIYAVTATDIRKHAIALSIVSRALNERSAVISAQVVQECLNVATRRLPGMSPTARRLWLSDYLMPLCKVFPSQDLYEHALGIHERFGVSFYDSSIVSAACLAGCKLLLTEDLQDGQKIDSVRVRNPFL